MLSLRKSGLFLWKYFRTFVFLKLRSFGFLISFCRNNFVLLQIFQPMKAKLGNDDFCTHFIVRQTNTKWSQLDFLSLFWKLHYRFYHDLQRYLLDWIVPHLAAICKAYFMAITCLYYKNFYQQGLAYTIYRLGQGAFKNWVEKEQHPRRQHKNDQSS